MQRALFTQHSDLFILINRKMENIYVFDDFVIQRYLYTPSVKTFDQLIYITSNFQISFLEMSAN